MTRCRYRKPSWTTYVHVIDVDSAAAGVHASPAADTRVTVEKGE